MLHGNKSSKPAITCFNGFSANPCRVQMLLPMGPQLTIPETAGGLLPGERQSLATLGGGCPGPTAQGTAMEVPLTRKIRWYFHSEGLS